MINNFNHVVWLILFMQKESFAFRGNRTHAPIVLDLLYVYVKLKKSLRITSTKIFKKKNIDFLKKRKI